MKSGLSCGNVCCVIFIIILSWLLNTLRNVGEFQLLYPKNVRQCRRIEGYHGCEDFAYFSDGTVIMSCDDRSWLRYERISEKNLSQRIASQPNQGTLYSLSPSNNYQTPIELTISNFNFPDFHPLGIASLEDSTGRWIYVTDNQRDAERVHFFKVIGKDNNIKLEYHSSAISNEYGMLNDIIAIPNGNGAFYTTIWLSKEPGTLGCFLDVMLLRPAAYLLYCQPPKSIGDGFLKNKQSNKEVEFECRRAVDNLKMANGITRSVDGKRVYLAETTGRTLNIYDRDIKSNNLTLVRKVSTFSGCDNIELADDGSIYLGCHPKGLSFQLHAAFPKSLLSPSRILKFTDKNSENDAMEILMESVGEILAGSSLGFPINGHMIVGSVHDNSYLLCPNFYDNLDADEPHSS